jgi:peptidyl-prolyl cis-trans isomerase D
MSEESVDVAYVELSWTDLVNDPSIEVTEEELLAAYEADKAANPPQEKRDASHILLDINDERTAEQARTQLLEIRERILGGESFEELAREFSADPGSAPAGGELGSLGKGVFVPEFEEALWQLEPGELSEPVETEFGLHLIRLNAIELEEFPAFEVVRAEIENRLRRQQAEGLFLERFRELDSLAFEQPDSLDGLSEALGLEIKQVQGVTRNAGSGIFGNVELREAVFADDVLENRFNSHAIEYVDNRAVVARVMERYEPAVRPFEEVADTIREQITTERARELAQQAQAAALLQVEAGESVAKVAADAGVDWQTVELARRNQPGVPREVLEAAFALQRPAVGEKAIDEAVSANGNRYVVTVTRVVDGDVSTMTESEIAGIQRLLAQRAANVDFESFYNTLEAEASISRPQFQ